MENTKLRASQKYKKRSTFDSIWRQLRKNKGAIVGMILLVVIIIIALVSPYIFNYETDVIANNVKERMQHPSSEHWFGTDDLGRDTSMILITHDLGIVAEVCDTVAVMYAGRIVEQGTLEDVFDHTKHPYTEGLFNSLPNIQNRTAMLKPIKGLMPDPTNLPEGCAFAPRCDYATDECSKRCPKLTKISDTHSFACLAYEHEGFHIKRGNE